MDLWGYFKCILIGLSLYSGVAMSDIREYLDKIVIGKHERGFQKHKKDSGNYVNGKLVGTNWGISAPTLAKYLGREPTMKDMKNLKKETALNIYEEDYVKKPGFDKLPKHLKKNIIDLGINASPKRAIKILQKLGGVKQDGILGPDTIKAAQNIDNNAYVAARKNFYSKLAKNKPEKSVFLKGWLKRADSFKTSIEPKPEIKIEKKPLPLPMKRDEWGLLPGQTDFLDDETTSMAPSELEQRNKENENKSYDKLSFRNAFNQAWKDKGEGATFMWEGKPILLKKA